MNSSFNTTLAAVTAGLTVKMAFTNLFTARCRTVPEAGDKRLRNDEDRSDSFPLVSLFRAMLIGYGPFADKDTMDRLISCARNNSENEPYFVMTALAWGVVTTPPEFGESLLVTYMATRYLHTFVYIFVRKQPYRALTWAPGILINLFMSAQVLQTVFSAK